MILVKYMRRLKNENKNQVFNELAGRYAADFEDDQLVLKVETIHGDVAIVRFGDWIIKEKELGKYYPIKDSIFKEQYGEIEE